MFPIGPEYIHKIQRLPITFNAPSNIEELASNMDNQDKIERWRLTFGKENTTMKTVVMKRGWFEK